MAKKTKQHLDDLEIVATLVAKTLRDRGEQDAPSFHGYVLGQVHGNGSTALEVRLKLTEALDVDLVGYWWPDQDLETLVSLAEEIADTIEDVRRDIPERVSFVADVLKTARRHVSNARRRGLRYRLISVIPSDIEIGSVREPAATMRIEMLNRALAPDIAVFDIEDPEDVEPMFQDCEAEQRVRAVAKATLDEDRATGAIDAVVLRALEMRGVDIGDTLGRMHETDYILDVEIPGEDRKMPLYWDDGVVRSSIWLAEGTTWTKGCLTFTSAPDGLDGKLLGKPVKAVFDHPYLEDETVVLRSNPVTPGSFAMVACTDRLLRFDARSGRVWEADAA